MAPIQPNGDRPAQYIEIELGRGRRWGGWIAFVLCYAAVSGVLMWFFMQLTPSLFVAGGAVLFMVAYMAVMGWLAGRDAEGRGSGRRGG